MVRGRGRGTGRGRGRGRGRVRVAAIVPCAHTFSVLTQSCESE